MDKSLPSFAYLLETDLARKGLSQRELAAKLTEQGEQPLTEQAISSWKSRGKVPGTRMARLLEILGPDSEVGKAHGQWQPPEKVETVRIDTIYPTRKNYIRQQVAPRQMVSRHAVEYAVRAALPEALRANFERAIPLGAISLPFDYISDNVVAEIKHIGGDRGMMIAYAYRALFQLALADSLHGAQRKPRVYGLLIISLAGANLGGLDRARLEAALMGLQVVVVDSPENAAKQIEEWEKTPPEDLFRS